ncbi:hypothetical protein GCM10007380_32550 [Gottfriedia solisilvae]|uniref:Uncharacterized protein n=1 Tax=Gottfriedia solisilvae TaxID=1516104 RepID=A0A8J3EYV1_9BACI|nr:hypothetical protein GCM10007380_32550 [Gottfriedia solisilvae]
MGLMSRVYMLYDQAVQGGPTISIQGQNKRNIYFAKFIYILSKHYFRVVFLFYRKRNIDI